jgi:hypothetical protein
MIWVHYQPPCKEVEASMYGTGNLEVVNPNTVPTLRLNCRHQQIYLLQVVNLNPQLETPTRWLTSVVPPSCSFIFLVSSAKNFKGFSFCHEIAIILHRGEPKLMVKNK